MSEVQTLVLGLIAGVTILLGLPIGRLKVVTAGTKVFLNATAIGVLLFLVWDVLSAAFEPVDAALGKVHDATGGIGPVFGYAVLFFAGIAVGLLSLVGYESWLARRASTRNAGPGAMAIGERTPNATTRWSAGRRLALLIAVGIGLHNFGEGLAIGGSAARGAIGLATLLVIGFALHNATEGFGIIAPLATERERPGWGFLLLMGLIGGGPTFVGTLVGRQFSSDAVSVIFLTLAAGSIIYVIVQLIGVALKSNRKQLLYYGVLLGLVLGFVTDMVVSAGGA